jgi:hypothetical protein
MSNSDDVESIAADLSDVTGGELDRAPVVAVEDGPEAVALTLELPSGTQFSDRFDRPPVWGPNCELKRLLDSFDLGPDEADELVGKRVPCDREVREDGIHFWVDVDALDA